MYTQCTTGPERDFYPFSLLQFLILSKWNQVQVMKVVPLLQIFGGYEAGTELMFL